MMNQKKRKFECLKNDDNGSPLSDPVNLVGELKGRQADDSNTSTMSLVNGLAQFTKHTLFSILDPIFHVDIPMRVVSISRTGKLGVCNKKNWDFIVQFHEKYESMFSQRFEFEIEESELVKGMLVAVPYKLTWSRAIVIKSSFYKEGKLCAKVYVIDFVSYATVETQFIRKVCTEDCFHPCRSFEFTLFGVTKLTKNEMLSEKEFDLMSNLLLGRIFLTQFVFSKRVDSIRSKYSGFLKTTNDDLTEEFCKDVGDLIISKGWAHYRSPHSILRELTMNKYNLNYPEQLIPLELILNTSFKVKIVQVNSLNDFYVIKLSDIEFLEYIQEILKASIKQSFNRFTFWKNEENGDEHNCIGMIHHGQEWHRVQLRKLFPEEKMVELFLMDRGDIVFKQLDEIYQAPLQLVKYPSMVVSCSLHLNLTPKGESLWGLISRKLSKLHEKCTSGDDLLLNCYKIVLDKHSVKLNTGHCEDYASALVKLGYATYSDENFVERGRYHIFRGSRDVFRFGEYWR